MTFSILVRDPETGVLGGAAATGSLCVGGWVLRGHAEAGLSASQGMAPSTFWGEDVLDLMANGHKADKAIRLVTEPDRGRDQRQLSALPVVGPGAVFSGTANTPVIADRVFENGVAAGNMLAGPQVVEALVEGYLAATGPLPERLLAAISAAESAGSDKRGLMSAALLVVSRSAPPLTLRVDYSEMPIASLKALYARATSGEYADWARQVPTLDDPERTYAGD